MVERREHNPPLSGRIQQLPVIPERRNHWVGKASGVPLLFLPVDIHTPVLKIDVFPADAAASRVIRSPEEFTHPNSGVCEDEHERAVTSGFQRRVASPLRIERIDVVREGGVRLDRLTRLLVNVTSEGVALFGRPGLLVAWLAAVIFREWRRRARDRKSVV